MRKTKKIMDFNCCYTPTKKNGPPLIHSDRFIQNSPPPSVGVATRKVGLSPVMQMPFSFGVGGKTFLKRHCQQPSCKMEDKIPNQIPRCPCCGLSRLATTCALRQGCEQGGFLIMEGILNLSYYDQSLIMVRKRAQGC